MAGRQRCSVPPFMPSRALESISMSSDSISGRGVRLLDQRPQLAEQFPLFQRAHIEEHHRPVAEDAAIPLAPAADHQRVVAGQPLDRAERAEIDAVAEQECPGAEV